MTFLHTYELIPLEARARGNGEWESGNGRGSRGLWARLFVAPSLSWRHPAPMEATEAPESPLYVRQLGRAVLVERQLAWCGSVGGSGGRGEDGRCVVSSLAVRRLEVGKAFLSRFMGDWSFAEWWRQSVSDCAKGTIELTAAEGSSEARASVFFRPSPDFPVSQQGYRETQPSTGVRIIGFSSVELICLRPSVFLPVVWLVRLYYIRSEHGRVTSRLQVTVE